MGVIHKIHERTHYDATLILRDDLFILRCLMVSNEGTHLFC